MTCHIALLRSINVGGRNSVAMADLRVLFEDLGFAGTRTLLQSGNLVFDVKRRTAAALEALLAAETKKRFGFDAEYFVRTQEEWEQIVAHNPFPEEAKHDPSHLLVVFLKKQPAAKSVTELQKSITGPEIVRADGRQVYIVYPAGIGRSKLSTIVIETKLGSHGTGRNWNTVLKLQSLAAA